MSEWTVPGTVLVPIDAALFGKRLAHLGSAEQAAIFNAMYAELGIACGGKHFDIESQVCAITDGLDNHGRAFVRALAEFVKLRDEAEAGKVHD